MKHQGKTLDCFSKSKASNHFIRTGDFLHFTDWRFIHMARLGTVPLNTYNRRNLPKTCRRCNYPEETLPYVINNCTSQLSDKITQRHNRIVPRLKKAALENSKWSLLREDDVYGLSNLKPGLILTNEKREALIIDVRVTFENETAALDSARLGKKNRKISNYYC